MNRSPVSVRRESIAAPAVLQLFSALNAELSALYTEEGANHFALDEHEVAEGSGAILVAWEGSTPVGCSAIRRIDGHTAELKRMYVVPAARGRGIALLLTRALEDEARRLSVRQLVLETGERQPEAIALAEKLGFVRVARFGEYVNSPLSVCMAKDLHRRG
jgi:putative acetyltransferase